MGRARLFRFRRLTACFALVAVACTATSGTVRGVVLEVEGTLSDVTAFTLLAEGERLRFAPIMDGEFSFPLSHLQEHLRTGAPVLVGWELIDDTRYAVSIEDG